VRSPGAAFAWEFRRRHRVGLGVLAGWLGVLAVARLVIGLGRTLDLDDLGIAGLVSVPLAAAFMYLLSVFCFGLSGDLGGRRSLYPGRLFTLPVSTGALAGWPMLLGAATMAAVWVVIRLLAVWPSGVEVPLVWPGVLAAVLLAWTQALTWMPYRRRGLRVVALVGWLVLIDGVALVALQFRPGEAVMVALLAPHLPVAYLAARVAVARARRGEPGDAGAPVAVASGRRRAFASPAQAQAWFEARQHGRRLPAMVAIVLPVELALLFVTGGAPLTVLWILLGALATPPFLARFVAVSVGRSGGEPGLAPFVATRPQSSAALVAAKLRVTLASALVAWLIVLIAVPLALVASGTWPVVAERAASAVAVLGAPRAALAAGLVVAALVVATWKQLVQGLYLGMSGRAWLVKGSAFLALVLATVLVPLAAWLTDDREAMVTVWTALPWIAAALVAGKLAAGAWVVSRLHGRGIVRGRMLVAGAAGWAVCVFALDAALAWLVPDLVLRGHLRVLVSILAIPLVRLAAAPLAVDWGRHRGRTGGRGGRAVLAVVLALLALPAGVAATRAALDDRVNGALVSSGDERGYLLHVPPGLDRARPVPLVISLHGAGGWPAQQAELTRWNRLADEEGFIVVYPAATGVRVWNDEPGGRDVRFIADLLDALASRYAIDPERIYVDGLSNGGGMAFALSCGLADRIAAVGVVAGAQTLAWDECGERRPMPAILFHGTADPIVPYRGGPSWMAPAPFPDVASWAARWAARNGCDATPRETAVAADVTRLEYCPDVLLYRIEGGGHTWPGGEPLPEWLFGRTSDGVDATRLEWAFFGAHQATRR
jgi:polyhydroxybutyrate depolymerase